MTLTRSARKALAETEANLFRLMLETVQRDCPGDPCLDPHTITLLTSIEMRGIAVAQFQKSFGLKVDGHPGAATFAALWELNKATRAQFEERMLLAAEDTGTIYTLGSGGYGWFQDDFDAECDCSGFIAFCLGLSRKPSTAFMAKGTKWWFSTDSMVLAAKEGVFFREVEKGTPGCLAAYPDYKSRGELRQGHTAYITDWRGTVPWGYDCSSSQSRKTGDAVKLRSLSFFTRHRAARYFVPTWWQD